MQKFTGVAIFLIAAYALSTGATAQNVYKCGSSYSQAPCPGGSTLDVTDARTPEQKEQTDTAVSRDIQTANAMEEARVLKEKTDLADNTPMSAATNAPFWTNTNSPPVSSPFLSSTKQKATKSAKQKAKPSTVDKVKKTVKKKTHLKTDKASASTSRNPKLHRHHPEKNQP